VIGIATTEVPCFIVSESATTPLDKCVPLAECPLFDKEIFLAMFPSAGSRNVFDRLFWDRIHPGDVAAGDVTRRDGEDEAETGPGVEDPITDVMR